MNFEAILKTLLMIGAEFPAYRALFEQVVALFEESDQSKLKEEYAKAMAAADAAHRTAQTEFSINQMR